MKTHRFITVTAAFVCMLFVSSSHCSDSTVIRIDPVGRQGTVSFIMHTDQAYASGNNGGTVEQTLIDISGLAKGVIQCDYGAVFIAFYWSNDQSSPGFYILSPALPGPQDYALIFTWDADRGLLDGYFNGIPFRTENRRYHVPWDVAITADTLIIPSGPIKLSDIHVEPKYITANEALSRVPDELRGQEQSVLRLQNLPAPMAIESRNGKLLYESPLDHQGSIAGWVLEGPAEIGFENGAMVMRSQIPDPQDGSTGHFNHWCPVDFPESFILEWEFKPISDWGVSHLFFAAGGQNGEDLFDPSLPERDGHYRQYHSDSIVNYYIIYCSNLKVMRTSNMATTWLVKSHNFSSLAMGDVGVKPWEKDFHQLRLIKDAGHIQLTVDGKVTMDFTDPGDSRWGPIYRGGNIGFRQMARMIAAYRNFRVWALQ